MDSATQDLYFQKINELIYDEDKIVTCNSLSLDLDVSLNDSKYLLSEYVKDRRDVKPNELAVTYLTSGVLKDGVLGVCIIGEDKIEDPEIFTNLISKIIYSVQKSKKVDVNIIDIVDKVTVDQFNDKVPSGCVVGKNCVKKKLNVKKINVEPKPSTTKATQFFGNKTTSNHEPKSDMEKKDNGQESKQSQSKQNKSKSKGGITNFFSKAPVRAKELIKPPSTEDLKEEHVEEVEMKADKENEAVTESINQNGTKIEEQMEIDEVKPKVEKNTSKRKKSVKTNDLPNKKRKRIQEICDSDSSDMFGDEEENIIVSDDEPEPLPVVKASLPPKNKVRKAVDRTYQDEEGYIVTTTEYIYESAPEEESKEALKPANNDKPKVPLTKKNSTTDSETEVKSVGKRGKKNMKPVSGKQTTLMSFFKKS